MKVRWHISQGYGLRSKWMCSCIEREESIVNALPHMLHWNGFSSWTPRLYSLEDRETARERSWEKEGRRGRDRVGKTRGRGRYRQRQEMKDKLKNIETQTLWTSSCIRKCPWWTNSRLHILHSYGRCFKCVRLWRRKLSTQVKRLLQMSQPCGFSPVCIYWCRRKFPDVIS